MEMSQTCLRCATNARFATAARPELPAAVRECCMHPCWRGKAALSRATWHSLAWHNAASCIGQHLDDGLGLEVRNDVPGVRLELRQRALGQHLAWVLQRAQHDVLDACLRTVLAALTSSTNLTHSLRWHTYLPCSKHASQSVYSNVLLKRQHVDAFEASGALTSLAASTASFPCWISSSGLQSQP